MSKESKRSIRLAGALLLASSSIGFGQVVAPVRAGTWELNGAAGYTYGIDEGAGSRSRLNGGATLSYAVTKMLLPYFEYSYFPGITRTQTGTFAGTGRTFEGKYEVPLSDMHAGVHLRFTIRESRLVPYAVFGAGAIRSHARNVQIRYDDATGLQDANLDLPGRSDFAVNFGGGLRYYIGQHAGVRFEGKVYKPTGTFSDPFGKLQFGVFFQF